ncbi:MAG: DUF4426 domain-containing protein [Gammaproteobacteria bacterium]
MFLANRSALMTALVRFVCVPIVVGLALASCESDVGSGQNAASNRIRFAEHESFKSVDGYTVQVSAMSTHQLSPEVARAYNIVRSDGRAMINIAVLKKLEGELDQPVPAVVEISAANLTGQLKNIELRMIDDSPEGIYYIGEVAVSNEEILNFDIDVLPEGQSEVIALRYSKQFYGQ